MSEQNIETIVEGLNVTSNVIETQELYKEPILNFTQSQSHGLYWDNEIRTKVFGINACVNDSKKYDIDSKKNKFDNTENISIKTYGNNTIDCGDILRFYDNDCTIIAIKYDQIGDFKVISKITEFRFTNELRDILFGTITKEILQEYVEYIKTIKYGYVPSEIKREYKLKKNELQQKYNMKINISPKLDSTTQRRCQCAIPSIKKLFETYPQFIITENNQPFIRGTQITGNLKSPKRIRTKKDKDQKG